MYGHEYQPRRISNDYFGVDVGLKGNWLMTVITASCAAGFSLVGYGKFHHCVIATFTTSLLT